MPSHAAAPDHHQSNLEETMTQPNHAYIRPGQVAQDRPAPEAAHQPPAFAGPFDTREQVTSLAAVRITYDLMHASDARTVAPLRNGKVIIDAFITADLPLGEYDHRIVNWLTNWEPEICAVIASWISRAHAAGSARTDDELAEVCRELVSLAGRIERQVGR
jgi:hypothetical protein